MSQQISEEQSNLLTKFTNPNNKKEDQDSALDKIIEQLVAKQINLGSIVLNLGKEFTSEDSVVRSRGVLLLYEIFNRVPELELSPENASTYGQFLSARLLDFPTVPNVLLAINALLKNFKLYENFVSSL